MHESALVPLESWAYANPKLLANGNCTNIGLFAESLIYYDTIYLIPSFPKCFNNLIEWLMKNNEFDDFLSLLNDGSVKIYDYEFMSTAVEKDGLYSIWNVQGEEQVHNNVFERQYLYNQEIEYLFPKKARKRIKIYNSFRGNVIEVKSDAFGSSIENARNDYQIPERNDLVIQTFIDEVFRYRGLGIPPKIKTTIDKSIKDQIRIIWNTDLSQLAKVAGANLNFNPGTPLVAFAQSNRFIWSAAATGFDLYLPNPISRVVGNKLYEASQKNQKLTGIIDTLKAEVDFPDIQELVNQGRLKLKDVLFIRNKATKFRDWIQSETERDRSALIAYHNEILHKTPYENIGKKALTVFGILGSGAVGGLIGTSIAGPVGGMLGGVAGSGVSFLTDMTSKLFEGWSPIVFGNWFKDDIERILRK